MLYLDYLVGKFVGAGRLDVRHSKAFCLSIRIVIPNKICHPNAKQHDSGCPGSGLSDPGCPSAPTDPPQ